MDDLIVLLKVFDLLHDLFENFGAVLWRIAVFYKADLDLQLQLIADVLIVQPVSKRRFGVDNLFDLLRQSLALVVDDSTINLFIGSVFKIIPVPQGKENKDKETSVYKGYKRDKIEMRGDRAEISDFPLYLNTVAGGLDCRDQTIGGFSFVVKIYAVPVVEIIG